jgi:type IV pilus assembly protein PilQ
LKLFGAKIPRFQMRPLITTRFKSAVDHVVPVQTPKMGDTALVAVQLREAVSHTIKQENNVLFLEFSSSTVPPRPIPEAERPQWVQAMKEAEATVAEEEEVKKEVVKEVVVEKAVAKKEVGVETPPEEAVKTAEGKKVFTGQRISLDFQDADIHNIFRILHEVSGENFVIGQDVKGRVTLKLDNVPSDQCLDLILKMNKLGTVVEGNVVRIATLSTLASEHKAIEAALKAQEAAEKLEPLVTRYIPVNYADASVVKGELDVIKTDRGKVSVTTRTNTIIITDTETAVERAVEHVTRVDVATPQVSIEARIVEANTNFTRDIGVQWGGDVDFSNADLTTARLFGGQSDHSFTTTPNWAVNLPPSGATSGISFALVNIAGTPFNLDARLMAMETQGRGRVISAPKIVTLDNTEAVIEQGTDIPYQTIDEGTVSLKFVSATLKLLVTPHVSADNRISMAIEATKNAPDFDNAVGGTPAISKKLAKTELLLNNGETIVIGGILEVTDTVAKAQVPGLSKIPVLGWLFKQKKTIKIKKELLIFITPRIVRLEEARVGST